MAALCMLFGLVSAVLGTLLGLQHFGYLSVGPETEWALLFAVLGWGLAIAFWRMAGVGYNNRDGYERQEHGRREYYGQGERALQESGGQSRYEMAARRSHQAASRQREERGSRYGHDDERSGRRAYRSQETERRQGSGQGPSERLPFDGKLFYFKTERGRRGPFDREELTRFLQRGRIQLGDIVYDRRSDRGLTVEQAITL